MAETENERTRRYILALADHMPDVRSEIVRLAEQVPVEGSRLPFFLEGGPSRPFFVEHGERIMSLIARSAWPPSVTDD